MYSLSLATLSTVFFLLSVATLITAHPHPAGSGSLSKRAASSQSISLGFGITIGVIVFGIIVFYLGVRRGKSGSWLCWRAASPPPRSPTVLSEKISVIDTDPSLYKPRISCPIPAYSGPVSELTTPVEQYKKTPEYLELAAATDNVIYELGESTPRGPTSTTTRNSFASTRTDTKSGRFSLYSSAKRFSVKSPRKSMGDGRSTHERKSSAPPLPINNMSWFGHTGWFGKSTREMEDEEKRGADGKDEDSENEDGALPAYPGPALARVERRPSTEMYQGPMEGTATLETQKKPRKNPEQKASPMGRGWIGSAKRVWSGKAYGGKSAQTQSYDNEATR